MHPSDQHMYWMRALNDAVLIIREMRGRVTPGTLAALIELRAYHGNLGRLTATDVRELPAGDTQPGLERGA